MKVKTKKKIPVCCICGKTEKNISEYFFEGEDLYCKRHFNKGLQIAWFQEQQRRIRLKNLLEPEVIK